MDETRETTAPAADAAPGRVPASLWWLATVLAAGSVMAGLDTSLVNVGLGTIAHDLDVSLVAAQWTNSGYLLALAAALPTCGWLCRSFGAGRVWLCALAAFTATSALCALAPDIGMLVTARVLQGVAGGALVPTGMTILGQAAGPHRMGRVISISSVPAILAPAVGPVVGALLISNLSWHWLFLVNVPVGLLGLALGLHRVPRGELGDPGRLDVPGLALVMFGLPLLVLSIAEATDRTIQLRPLAVWLPAIAGVGALTLFVRRSLGHPAPLMDLRPLGDRVFRAAAAEVFFLGAALFGGLIVLPLYFQLQLDQGIVRTGLLLMAFSVGATVAFPVAGLLTDRHGGGAVAIGGLVITVVSTVPMALLPATPNLVLVEFLQFTRGVGLALSGSPGVAAALATVAHRQIPDATSEVNILSRLGGALGSAVCAVVLSNGVFGHAGRAVDAFHTAFWWLTGTALIALVTAVWLTWEQRRNPVGDQTRIRWSTNDRIRSVGRPTVLDRPPEGTT